MLAQLIRDAHGQVSTRLTMLRHGQDLKARATRSSLWLGAGGGSEQVLRLARNMILARLLAPEAFGVFAIVMAANAAVESFTQLGVREAIIQSPYGRDRTYLNAAWWVSTLRGIALYAFAFLVVAPILARLYPYPSLLPMLRVSFVSMALMGMLSPGTYLALKNLRHSRWVIIQNGGGILGILTAIALGWLWGSAWALVAGLTAEALFRCVLSFAVSPYWPSIEFDREHSRALWAYARGMFGVPIFVYLYRWADVFVVGRICGPSDLGKYSLAISLVTIFYMLYDMFGAPLVLPAFSEAQDRHEELWGRFLHVSRLTGIILLPGLTIMACGSKEILGLLYGQDYAALGGVLRLLCIGMATRVLGSVLVAIYLATGHPHLNRRAAIIRTVLMLIMIVPFVQRMGLEGAALAQALSGIVWLFLIIFHVTRLMRLPTRRFFGALGPGFAASLALTGAYFVFNNFFR